MVTLFDQFGQPIDQREIRRPEIRRIAQPSLRDRDSDSPSRGLTPERLARILKAAEAGDMRAQAELFEDMEEKDAHLASQLQIRKLAVQGLPWEIVPAGEDARSRQVADFCRQAVGKLSNLDELLLDLLDAVGKGFSLVELLWDVSGRQAILGGWEWIHPKKVTFFNSLAPRVLTEADPAQGEDLPPFKFVYHRYKARSGQDTRAGVLRTCCWMYLFKNYSVKDWVAFAEIFGVPLRLGKYDPTTDDKEKSALLAALRALGTDGAGIISKNTEIEFVEASKTTSVNVYESLTSFCDAQMSKAILGQVLTSEASGKDGSGSRALGQVHNEVRGDLVKADAKSLGRTITEQILRPLVGFNFGWDVPCPAFNLVVEEAEDTKALADTYAVLVERVGLDVSQEHVSARFKIPLRQKGETPLAPPSRAAAPEAPAALKGVPAGAVALKGDSPAEPHPADLVAARLVSASEADLEAWLTQIRELLARSASLEDFQDGLVVLFKDLDPVAMADRMAQALTVADLAGRFDALG